MENTLNLTKNPSFGIFSFKNHFIHLEVRIGQVNEFIKNVAIKHVEYLEKIKISYKLKGYLQLRRLFYNDKSGVFECVIDYLTDKDYEPKPDFTINNELEIIDGLPTYVDFKIVNCSLSSDHFDKNHRDFYMSDRVMPWISDFDKYILQRLLEDLKEK